MWLVTCDTLQVTRDTWRITCGTWHMTHSGGWTVPQNFSSWALPVWDWQRLEDIWTKGSLNQSVNQSMKDRGDCRTAPAPPGLLKRRQEQLKLPEIRSLLVNPSKCKFSCNRYESDSSYQHAGGNHKYVTCPKRWRHILGRKYLFNTTEMALLKWTTLSESDCQTITRWCNKCGDEKK